jgi:hypothetical protein
MPDTIQPVEKNFAKGGVFANPESYKHITTPHSQADGKFWNDKNGDKDGVLGTPTSHSKKGCKQYGKPPNHNQEGVDHTYGTTVGKASKRRKF